MSDSVKLRAAKLIHKQATDNNEVWVMYEQCRWCKFDPLSAESCLLFMTTLGIEAGEGIGNTYYAGKASTRGGHPYTTHAKTIPEAVYNCVIKILEDEDERQ